MEDDDKIALARSLLSGIASRDWPRIRSLLADSVVWTLPGQNRISGEARGPDAVIARMEHITGCGVDMKLLDVLVGQNNVALSLHNTATAGDVVLDQKLATVCTVRDGKIAAIDTYVSHVEGLNRFWV